jgi:hypothetical protein
MEKTFGHYLSEIKGLVKMETLPSAFKNRVLGYFVDGLTAEEAVKEFCQNQNTDLEKEILELFNKYKNESKIYLF